MTRSPVRRSVLSGLVAALGLVPACGGLPPDVPLPQTITTIQLPNSVICPDPLLGQVELPGVIPINVTCEIRAEVFDEWGIPISEPRMVWKSSNTSRLTATGSSKVGTLRGKGFGQVTVTASDPQEQVRDQKTITVVASR